MDSTLSCVICLLYDLDLSHKGLGKNKGLEYNWSIYQPLNENT